MHEYEEKIKVKALQTEDEIINDTSSVPKRKQGSQVWRNRNQKNSVQTAARDSEEK